MEGYSNCTDSGSDASLLRIKLSSATDWSLSNEAFSPTVNGISSARSETRSDCLSSATDAPLTVTDSAMTRYWISMDEAVRFLCLAACADKVSGLLVLDMGEPVRLMDVAQRLWKIVGSAANPLQVSYIGLRPGERLHERVSSDRETVTSTMHPGVLEVRGSVPAPIGLSDMLTRIRDIEERMAQGDLDALRRQIAALAAQ